MKKNFVLMSVLFLTMGLAGCTEVETPHEHSFKTEWAKNETQHWHNASCEHTDLTKDLGTHEYGNDNICDVCGYELIVIKKHYVYFVTMGGSPIDPIQVLDGEKIYAPRDPAKENYAFLGWYENPEYAGKPYDFNQNITENITLYALWGAKISFINYDGDVYQESNVRLNTKIDEPQNPTWNNAHFIGWYSDRDFVGTSFDFETGVDKNTKLYARYGYKLEFIDIDGSTISSTIQPVDKVVNAPDPITRENYNFGNWYSDSECTEVFEFEKKLTQDTKVYLKLEPKSYKITYVYADGLTHSNPNAYIYGVGVDFFLEPTAYEYESTKKFYGWYFDDEFKVPATNISVENGGDVTVYAKIGTYHSITYKGWPESVTNPNPTKVTEFDIVNFDGSALDEKDGVSNVKFKVDSTEVLSLVSVLEDTVVNVEFSTRSTDVKFDPNGGKILPKTPFIYIDGPIKEGKKKIEITENDGTFNLYDSSVMDQMVSVSGREGVFKGYYKDSGHTMPLNKYETNYLESGSTIYADFQNLTEKGNDRNLPYQEEGDWGDGNTLTNTKEITLYLNVPKGYKTLNISMEVDADGNHSVVLINRSGLAEKIKSWSDYRDFTIKETVNIEGMTKLSFEYLYNGTSSSFEHYSLSFSLGSPDNCFVQCIPSEQPLTSELYYLKDIEVPYDIVEKEYHTFDGWLDENNNKVDMTSEWLKTDFETTLKASWVYNGITEFVTKAVNLCEEYKQLFDTNGIDFDYYDIVISKTAITMDVLEPYLKKTEIYPNLGYEQDLENYNDFVQAAKQKMWDLLGSKLISKLQDYKKDLVDAYSDRSEILVTELNKACDKGLSDLYSLVYDPAGQITSYINTKMIFENLITLYIC